MTKKMKNSKKCLIVMVFSVVLMVGVGGVAFAADSDMRLHSVTFQGSNVSVDFLNLDIFTLTVVERNARASGYRGAQEVKKLSNTMLQKLDAALGDYAPHKKGDLYTVIFDNSGIGGYIIYLVFTSPNNYSGKAYYLYY